MNFYIDFEANAITEEIISIGCCTERGAEFYSLVRPVQKLDHKIKELTGITQEEADEAPTIDEVMELFRNWADQELDAENTSNFLFYCWGNHDKQFIQKTCELAAHYNDTKAVLGSIANRLVDCMPSTAQMFHRKQLNLRSAYLTMRNASPDEVALQHNALGDAKMLMWVMQNRNSFEFPADGQIIKAPRVNMHYGKPKKRDPRYEIAIHIIRPKSKRFPEGKEYHFTSIYQAVGMINGHTRDQNSKDRICERILNNMRANDKLMRDGKEPQTYAGKLFLFENENPFLP